MHDILEYAEQDPVYRRWQHNLLTFSMLYAFTENFILPFSHDEVVHGKRAMLDKMPGDAWQKYATLRTLYGLMYGHPGKKLLFMGSEFGQWREWDHDQQPRLASARRSGACGAAALRAGAQLAPAETSRRCTKWISNLPAFVGSIATTATRALWPSFAWRARPPTPSSSSSISRRCRVPSYRLGVPEPGLLRGTAEQRQRHLRRQQPGKRRRRCERPDRPPRFRSVDRSDGPSARVPVLKTSIVFLSRRHEDHEVSRSFHIPILKMLRVTSCPSVFVTSCP